MSDTEEVCRPDAPLYCGVCSLPPEYCEHGATAKQCREWLEKNEPEFLEELLKGVANMEVGDNSKPQTRGGKGRVKAPKKVVKEKSARKVIISRQQRNRRKFVTSVEGLETCDVDLKKAAKFFGSKFACGSSVSSEPGKGQVIVIQGDFVDDLPQILATQYNIKKNEIQS